MAERRGPSNSSSSSFSSSTADAQRRGVGAVVDGIGDDLAREELGPLRDVVVRGAQSAATVVTIDRARAGDADVNVSDSLRS